MREHFVQFMQKVIDNKQAEVAPPLQLNEEFWYLPMFGVYHPQKPKQICVVFDSSAKHEGVALNDVLLSGSDLNNALLGVLIRFRREPIAITADVEQMFYCFTVREHHRNLLRFIWFKDNDITKEIIEYCMKVHVQLITLARNKSKASDQNTTNPKTQAKLSHLKHPTLCIQRGH